MDYQWYPGHMTKARRMMQENIALIDLLIELTDARVPGSGRNPDIDTLAKGKSRIVVLNKADLADDAATKEWRSSFEEEGLLTAAIDSRKGSGVRQLKPLIDEACAQKLERNRRRGIINRPVRAMIAGIPNVGKSTFINSFAGKAAARTGDKPGVTKGKQWIRLNKNVELLDTPGILWPKFDDREVGMKLALVGSMRDEITDSGELAAWLIRYLEKEYPDVVEKRYDVLPDNDVVTVLRGIARRRGCLKAGGEEDLEKASKTLIDDFRSGRLGKITLEKV
jgi:ribosome biogenesis GTPase A